MSSVVKKRKKKMRKHKHRKMLKKTRWQRKHKGEAAVRRTARFRAAALAGPAAADAIRGPFMGPLRVPVIRRR